MESELGRFLYWLGQNATAVQAFSSIVIAILTLVLAYTTWRYMKLTGQSVLLAHNHLLLSVFPKLKLLVSLGDDRRRVHFKVVNMGTEDIKIISVEVKWCAPPNRQIVPRSFEMINGHVQPVKGMKGTIIVGAGIINNSVELSSSQITADYLDVTPEEAISYLTLRVTCTNMVGIGSYLYTFNSVDGYTTRLN